MTDYRNTHRFERGRPICAVPGAVKRTRGWPLCILCCRKLRRRGERPPVQTNPAFRGRW